MKKEFLAAVMAGLLALSLTGCGSKNTEITQENDIIQNESESVKTTEDTTNGGSTEGTVEVTLADGNLQVALASLGDQVLIDTSVLDGEAEAFANWKKGI